MRLSKKTTHTTNQLTEIFPEPILQEFQKLLLLEKQWKSQKSKKKAKERFKTTYVQSHRLLTHTLIAVIDFKLTRTINKETVNALKGSQEKAKQVGAICRALVNHKLVSVDETTQLVSDIYLPNDVRSSIHFRCDKLVLKMHIENLPLQAFSAFLAASCITHFHLTACAARGQKFEEWEILTKLLKANNKITFLDLTYNNIGPEGCRALANLFKHNPNITSINLRGNNIGSAGSKILAEVLKHNDSITSIDLHSNRIGPEGAEALAKLITYNRRIITMYLDYNRICDNKKMDQLYKKLAANKKFNQEKIPQFKKTVFNLFCIRECLRKSNQLNFPKPIMTKIAMHTDKEIYEMGINNVQRY